MTALAVKAEFTSVRLVLFVAVEAPLRHFDSCSDRCCVAGDTLQTCVFPFKLERSVHSMVKLPVIPAVGIVTARAVETHFLFMRLILTVAVLAVSGSVNARFLLMAAVAIDFGVDAD